MKEKTHLIFGIGRGRNGAFENAFNLALNLKERGYKTKYFSNWFDQEPLEINLLNEKTSPFNIEETKQENTIAHLESHTWVYNGFFDIIRDKSKKIFYKLHAIIPYFHMNPLEKEIILKGELEEKRIRGIIQNLSIREQYQLQTMNQVDYLLTISNSHKEIVKKLGATKPIYVFENISDMEDFNDEEINKQKREAQKLREEIGKENLLLYCGRLYKQKGSFRLFEAFSKIKKEFNSSSLILLGYGKEELQRLKGVGLKEENEKDIFFVPWIEKKTKKEKLDFLKYYLTSDVLIQPRNTPELYSKTVIDAMSIGLPTITCESPYTIGKSSSAQEIFDSFVNFKENPKEVTKIVKRAKEKIKRENTWDSYISRLEKIVD